MERENIFLRRRRKTKNKKEKNNWRKCFLKEKKTGEGKYSFGEEKEKEGKILEEENIHLAEEKWNGERKEGKYHGEGKLLPDRTGRDGWTSKAL